jgi:hypothetical protein
MRGIECHHDPFSWHIHAPGLRIGVMINSSEIRWSEFELLSLNNGGYEMIDSKITGANNHIEETKQSYCSKTIQIIPSGEKQKLLTGYKLEIHFTDTRQLVGDDITANPPTKIITEYLNKNHTVKTLVDAKLMDNFKGEITFVLIKPTGQIFETQTITPTEFQGDTTKIVLKNIEETVVTIGEPSTPHPADEFTEGRLIDLYRGNSLEDYFIVIYASTKTNPEPEDFYPIVETTSGNEGYFRFKRPQIKALTAAYAKTSKTDETIGIKLDDYSERNPINFPKRLILVLETGFDDQCDEESDCDKLGFRGHNNIIEEFTYHTVVRTSEPEIEPLELYDYTVAPEAGDIVTPSECLVLNELIDILNLLSQIYPTNSSGISLILEQIIEIQSCPEIPNIFCKKAKTYLNILELYRNMNASEDSEYRLRGDLEPLREHLYSFNCQPQPITRYEKKLRNDVMGMGAPSILERDSEREPITDCQNSLATQRKVLGKCNAIDWDEQPTIYQAVTISHGHILKFKQEWIANGYGLGDLLYSLPLAPGQKKKIVVLDWERRESAANSQSVSYEESINNSLSRDRDINEIAKGTVNENVSGGSDASTYGWGVGAGIGAIIPGTPVGALVGAGGGGGGADSHAWQNNRRKIATSNIQKIRDKTVQAGNALRSQRSTVVQTVSQGERFEVNSEIVANYNHCHAITMQYFEVVRQLVIRHKLTQVQECLFVPLKISIFDIKKALRWKEILYPRLIDRRYRKGFSAMERIYNLNRSETSRSFAEDNIRALQGELSLTFQLAKPKVANSYDEDKDDWNWFRNLLPSYNAEHAYNILSEIQEYRNEDFLKKYGEITAKEVVKKIEIVAVSKQGNEIPLNLDLTLISMFENDRPLRVNVNAVYSGRNITRQDIQSIKLTIPHADEDQEVLPTNSRVIANSCNLTYQTDRLSYSLVDQTGINDDLYVGDPVILYTPPSSAEKQNPTLEEQNTAFWLLNHLNDNIEYYHKAIWMEMDPDRRFMLLDQIKVDNESGISVASAVDNQVVGIVGNSLIMPVSPGIHLDPTFTTENEEDVSNLLDFYGPPSIDDCHISLPTKGVFAEGVKAYCNSCEKIDDDRFWRWEESPIPDNPTPIDTIGTGTRRSDPGVLAPNDFPSQVINMQAAPVAPDPSGLASILENLSKGDIFRDITGLTQNQQNALASFQQAMKTAEGFGSQAAQLTNVAAQMRTLKWAKDKKLIDNNQAKQHANEILRNSQKDKRKDITQNPVFDQILQKAADSTPTEIEVEQPGGDKVKIRTVPPSSDPGTTSENTNSNNNSVESEPDSIQRPVSRFINPFYGVSGIFDREPNGISHIKMEEYDNELVIAAIEELAPFHEFDENRIYDLFMSPDLSNEAIYEARVILEKIWTSQDSALIKHPDMWSYLLYEIKDESDTTLGNAVINKLNNAGYKINENVLVNSTDSIKRQMHNLTYSFSKWKSYQDEIDTYVAEIKKLMKGNEVAELALQLGEAAIIGLLMGMDSINSIYSDLEMLAYCYGACLYTNELIDLARTPCETPQEYKEMEMCGRFCKQYIEDYLTVGSADVKRYFVAGWSEAHVKVESIVEKKTEIVKLSASILMLRVDHPNYRERLHFLVRRFGYGQKEVDIDSRKYVLNIEQSRDVDPWPTPSS